MSVKSYDIKPPKYASHIDEEDVEEFNPEVEVVDGSGDPWMVNFRRKLHDNDIEGMKNDAKVKAMYNVMNLAENGTKDDSTKLMANKLILEMTGHGPIKQVNHNITKYRLPPNQLIPIILSKLETIRKHDPDFVLEAHVEAIEESEDEDG